MTKLTILTGILLSAAFCSFAQTPGLIFKSAGTGAVVLDPNGDGYTSSTPTGFTTNDQAQSEIPYKALVVPAVEPVADPGPGPDCGFTDIVDSGAEDPVFTYFDSNGNLLFRFRLGNAASNSKGYSILIDTDQKFGSAGANADPNAVTGNPGFEIEIVLRTNFSVSLYDVNGTSSPILKTDALSYDNYAQKSIALTTNCGNADYFYDFYIPFSVITANFPGVNTTTPLRIVAVTSMNPAPAIGNNAVSDVGGIDDQAYGYNFDNIFQTIIDNFTPTPVTGIGTARDRSACPAITSPVANSATTIYGTSTEIGATIKVYKGTTEPLTQIGTAIVGAGGSWVATVPAVSTGEVISASATNLNEGESYYSCSQITVTNCSSPIQPYNLVRESNRKYISGNATPGGIIKVYLFTAGSYVLQTGTFTLDPSGDGTFCWVPGLNTNTCTPPNGSGALVNGTTYYVTQTVNGCESAKAPICVDNQVSVTPTLTQTALYTNTTTVSGTSGSGASITIYANGTSISTTTATGTSWTATVNLSTHAGKYISVGAVDGTKCMAIPLSAAVLVTNVPAVSVAPTITGSYCGTSTGTAITVSGTSTESNGTVITLYINGVSAGTTTVFNSAWSKVLTAKGGDILTATATAPGESVSGTSAGITVNTSGSAPSVTFTTPIIEGSTSVSGTFTGSGTLKVYIDGAFLGSTSSNAFTISGLTAFDLYAGGILKATLTSGGCESALSSGTTVDCLVPSTSIAVSPSASAVCEGSATSVTLTASQSGIIYQLYNDATASGSSRLGTGNDLALTSGTLSVNTTLTVKALKISSGTCASTLTGSQIVTVTPTITGNTITAPSTASFCQSGDPDKITGSLPGGGNGSFTYQWRSSTDNVTYNDISAANDKDYDPGVTAQTTYFKRIVTSATCQSTSASPAVITIENTTISNTISSLVSTSLTDTGVPAMDGNNSGGGITYAWQSSSDNITFTNTGITTEDYSPGTSVTNTTYFRRIATNGLCSVISSVITYSVNHTPTVSDFLKSGSEDQDISFTSTDFTGAYSDNDSNPLTQIRIESISGNGTLYSGATTLGAGSVVLLADLANLVFSPASNYNGSTSFSWKGFDGSVYSTSTSTVTLAIAAVNDTPSAGNNTVAVFEDTEYSFTPADFNALYSDIDGNAFGGIQITTLPAAGVLKINGVDALSNAAISVSDLSASLFTFTPAANANGNGYTSFTFLVSDGTQYSSSAYTLTINVNAVNDSPSFTKGSDQNHLTNAGAVTINGWATNISAGPSNEAGQSLTFNVTNDNNALFSVQPDVDEITGNLTYTIAPATNGTASINVVLSDNGGISNGGSNTSAMQNFTINVSAGANNPPVATDAVLSLNENTSNGSSVHTVVSTDADGNTLFYSITAGNSAGAFAINSSTGEITVADITILDYETTTQFVLIIKVSDGTSSDNATITINLNNLNDNTPVANDATVSINENTTNGTSVHTVVANDADGNSLTYTILAGNTTGAFTISSTTGAITVADATELDYETLTQFVLTVRVSDGTNHDDATITIDLNNLNDNTPVANDATASINENTANGTSVHTVVASDADGNALTYTITAGNTTGAFTISSTTGTITVADATDLDYETLTQFVLTVRVSDGTNHDDVTITIDLNDLNDNTPVANDATVSISENTTNGTSVHTVVASDADGSSLTYTITTGNTTGAFAINSTTGAITVADVTKLDYETLTQFVLTVRVSDGANHDDATITIDLNNLNDNTPVANDATASINENTANGTSVHTVVASDADGNALTYTITAGNTTGAFTISSTTGTITVADATDLDYETLTQFVLTVRVSDGTNHDDATITIDLNDLNDNTPVANDAAVSINENITNGTSVHTVVANDADGNALTYTITAGNTSGAFTINSTTGTITVADATDLDYETLTQFVLTVRASDGTNHDDATITINLNNLNDNTPIANDASVSINENANNGTPVHTVVASDADGNSLTYTITTGNTSGTFAISSTTGAITVADATKLDYETVSQFILTVRVSDGTNHDDATITINLNNLNDNTPVANDATVSINENTTNGTSVHTVVASDADGSALTYTITAGNTSGAFTISSTTGAITVADATKLDHETLTQFVLTVRVSDGTNHDDATITINLNNLNDNTPVANDATISINENTTNGTSIHTVVANDADGNSLTYTITTGNTTGAFTISSTTGAITVADATRLDYETLTQFVLTVRVSDGTNHDDATITINLNNLNDNTPVANDAAVSINENTTNGTSVHTVVASDADGNSLTYTITAGNTSGAFTISSTTGAITVADATRLDYETLTQFVLTVRVSDGTNHDDATITIDLNDLNDNAPIANDASISINENASNGTSVHTVAASDADGNALTYTITAGNTTEAFTISSTTGAITVADATKLDYETLTQFVLTVNVSDGTNYDDATITIDLNNLNDNAPVANDANVSVDENSPNGTVVHTTTSSDPDGSTITYSITAGNGSGAFTIDPVTGIITVNDQTELDYETTSQFILTVLLHDGSNSISVTITINLTDLPDLADTNTSLISATPTSVIADGTVSHITVQLKDINGNDLTASDGTITLFTTLGSLSTVTDKNDGSYEATITSLVTGTATITANLDGVAITDDATVVFTAGAVSPATTVITASLNAIAADGTSTSLITVQAKDINGNNLTTGGDLITIATTKGTISGVTDSGNGTYTATLTSSTSAGSALITGTANGAAIADDETVNFVAEIASAATSTITSASSVITADGLTTTTITIQLKDINGNNITVGGADIDLFVTLGTLSTVIDNGNGSYTVILTSSTTVGIATITGSIDGVAITDNAVVNFIAGPSSEMTTQITASVSSILADGISVSILTIQTKDVNGNNLTVGGDMITLSTTAGTLTNVTDNGDGTYTATLTSSTTANVAVITGTLNGTSIHDTEEVEFTATSTILTGSITSNLTDIPADGVSTATITITVKDQNNNPVSGLILNASTTTGTLTAVTDNDDGTYTITLTSSTTPGNAEVTVAVDGIQQELTIVIEFTPVTPPFFIPEGFSPDGDGVNDAFVIKGAEAYKVTLKVYNRWGNIVYENSAYKNDWEGQANQGIVLGQKLPDGTYFYAIDLNDGEKPYVRYFTIKRK